MRANEIQVGLNRIFKLPARLAGGKISKLQALTSYHTQIHRLDFNSDLWRSCMCVGELRVES